VIAGHRHCNCIETLSDLSNLRSVTNGPESVGENIQGFLTSFNRFVDRKEGAEIAFNNGQINEKVKNLYSEDLY
jgi:hypothetical protein